MNHETNDRAVELLNRIPIVSWLRAQAAESLAHAHLAGAIDSRARVA